MKPFFILGIAFMLAIGHVAAATATHPLITDDTGTQGKGKFQIEVNTEFGWDRETEHGVRLDGRSGELSTTFSAGLRDDIDIVLGVPYQWYHLKEDGSKTSGDGFGDITLELKWRFYDKEGWSLALKPGLSIPTGDEDEGFGTGEITYGVFFITQKEADPWTFLLNLGYARNENNAGERKDIWQLSTAVEYAAIKDLTAAANVGIETSPDPASNTHPIFLLGGLIWSMMDNIDLDIGIKYGLNRAETDITFLAGIAWRF